MPKNCLKKLSLIMSVFIIIFVISSCDFPQKLESTPESQNESIESTVSVGNLPSYQWPSDNAFVENITPFSGGKIIGITPNVNSVLITIALVEESAFKLYVNALKQLGFTEVVFENELTYSATKQNSSSGKREGVTVNYNKNTSTMTIDSSIEIIG